MKKMILNTDIMNKDMIRLIPILLLLAIICAVIPLFVIFNDKLASGYVALKITSVCIVLYKLTLFVSVPSVIHYAWTRQWKLLIIFAIIGVILACLLKMNNSLL